MNFTLTCHYQHSKKCKDGKSRNYLIYFLNGVEILKQKRPFDETMEKGFDAKGFIRDEFIFNGRLFQTRFKDYDSKKRFVSFPISKRRLAELNVPLNIRISILN
jgi:hypothetical protein